MAGSGFEIHTIAKLAATEQLLVRVLAHLAINMKHKGMDHDEFLSGLLDATSDDLDLMTFPDLSDEEADTVREIAKERLAEIFTGASAR